MRKVIDCFTFYNEFKILDLRLAELQGVVDHFVLVESNKTHSGAKKALFFDQVKERYRHYPIVHVIVEDMPSGRDAWDRENHQRNCISRGLGRLSLSDSDLIVVADVDEIPDPCTLELIVKSGINNECYELEMDFYYYNFRCKWDEKWYHPKVVNFAKYKEIGGAESVRKYIGKFAIPNGGWHLSYFGDIEFIRNKLISFAHQEYNSDEYTNFEHIEKCIREGVSLFGDAKTLYVDPARNNYLPRNWHLLT